MIDRSLSWPRLFFFSLSLSHSLPVDGQITPTFLPPRQSTDLSERERETERKREFQLYLYKIDVSQECLAFLVISVNIPPMNIEFLRSCPTVKLRQPSLHIYIISRRKTLSLSFPRSLIQRALTFYKTSLYRLEKKSDVKTRMTSMQIWV